MIQGDTKVGHRKFTVMAPNCELLRLGWADYLKIKQEFPKANISLFKGVVERLLNIVKTRVNYMNRLMDQISDTPGPVLNAFQKGKLLRRKTIANNF